MTYTQQYDGDRVRPVMKGYRMKCCTCNTVHIFDFFVVHQGRGHAVEFTVKADKRANARIKRKAKR